MKLVTTYDPPPIPYRGADWTALDDDTYDGPDWNGEAYVGGSPVGEGATEAKAVEDLMEKLVPEPVTCEVCHGHGVVSDWINEEDKAMVPCLYCDAVGVVNWREIKAYGFNPETMEYVSPKHADERYG